MMTSAIHKTQVVGQESLGLIQGAFRAETSFRRNNLDKKYLGHIQGPFAPVLDLGMEGHTTCHLAIPTRGFTAAVSVFRGTPPQKPLKCSLSAMKRRQAFVKSSDPRGGQRGEAHVLFVVRN